MKQKTMRQYEMQIKLYQHGITSKISHSAAQNMIADRGFDLHAYLDECRAVLLERIPQAMVDTIMEKALDEAVEAFAHWLAGVPIPGNGGSQVRPSVLLEADALHMSEYVVLLQGFSQLQEAMQKALTVKEVD